MAEPWLDRNVFCGRGRDECDGIAEPEEDGEVRYYKCTKPECGFEFGYQVIAPEPDNCQLGVPEGIRLAHLAVNPDFQQKLNEANRNAQIPGIGPSETGVFLGSIIRRRAEP